MERGAQINEAPYLGLVSITQPGSNQLHITIEEAGPTDDPDPKVPRPFEGLRQIQRRPSDRTFSLRWKSYVAYSVRNESFTSRDTYEQFTGRLFVEYSKSRYLEFIKASTIASDDYPGPLKHYGLFCLDHIIDVIAVEAPEIEV